MLTTPSLGLLTLLQRRPRNTLPASAAFPCRSSSLRTRHLPFARPIGWLLILIDWVLTPIRTWLAWTIVRSRFPDCWTTVRRWVISLLWRKGPATQLLVLKVKLCSPTLALLVFARTRTGALTCDTWTRCSILTLPTLGRLRLRRTRLQLHSPVRLMFLLFTLARQMPKPVRASTSLTSCVAAGLLLISRTCTGCLLENCLAVDLRG